MIDKIRCSPGKDYSIGAADRRIWLVVLLTSTIGFSGCRGTLHSYSQRYSEPSFDRLLELENASHKSARDDQSTEYQLSDHTSVHRQVAQRRPGSAAAASRQISDRPDDLSTDNAMAEGETFAGITDHAELLHQTQAALKNRYTSPSEERSSVLPASSQLSQAKKPSPTDQQTIATRDSHYDANEDGSVTMRMSDRLVRNVNPSGSNAQPSELAVVTADFQQPAERGGPVQTAAHNRYTQQNIGKSHSGACGPECQCMKDASLPTAMEKTAVDLKWEEHLQEALKKLSSQSSSSDTASQNSKEQMRAAVIRRLIALALGDREQMTAAVEGMQPNEQEYIKYQLTALMDAIDPEANPVSSRRWSLVMLSQRKAHEHLSTLGNLEIRNLSFCTEVESYGVTEQFPKYQFSPDQEALLYCELDNFVSERSKDGKSFETQLQGSYEIIDGSGSRVADQLLPIDSHVCRNRRRDYFIAYRIYMPQNIQPGNYTLKLTIEDLKGKKFGQSEVTFQIQ